ncbi:uncharacterized protein PFLUO_LOCUS460 [Penicillium psychrofluorescens]|uniref:uncharacterized protein n=1 Tax=Penicillium psychrofluorescens TaxID=3158075 RepID=UPI003CCC9104
MFGGLRSAKAVVSETRSRLDPTAMAYGPAKEPVHNGHQPLGRTITSLKRWSVLNKELPAVSDIRAIHVYDFDNTLFLSPLPNPQLWNGQTIGFLQTQECFVNGGWWHDPNILSATGKGKDVEEARGWNGWWNEQIYHLVTLSMQQKDALTVLLTGRSEFGFADIIKRMVASRNLEFDLVGLKPEVGPNSERFSSTMNFKQTFLEDIILTYGQAEDIRVYEDRVKHVKGFRDFFESLNRDFQSGQGAALRRPINAEVIQVTEGCTFLDPVTETAEVQRMINAHNGILHNPTMGNGRASYSRLRIKRTVFYTAYLISQEDSNRMTQELLAPLLPPGLTESNDLKYLANSIMITPRPASKSIRNKAGGMGHKLKWQITGTGVFENRVWAARVLPVPPTAKYFTESPAPLIVLAVRKGVRPAEAGKIQNWHPVPADKALNFETVVGEKAVLRIEEDNEWESQPAGKTNKRRLQQERDDEILYPQGADYDSRSNNYNPYQRPAGENRSHYDDSSRRGPHRSRGRGTGRGRGSARGGRGRGRGRDGGHPYRSLDDHTSGYDGSHDEQGGGFMNY